MTQLPEVTVIAITTRDHAPTIAAIKKTLEHITPDKVIFFSDVYYEDPDFQCVPVQNLTWDEYNKFLLLEAWKYVGTSHILVIQWDGHVLDGDAWNPEFLEYDYIGAPWTYKDGRNVGNGGFSLRSKRLHEVITNDKFIDIYSPEDEIIGRLYRTYLEFNYGIKYAPEELAHAFAFEMHPPRQKTFGFHQNYHQPFKEPIVLKRTGAMGDVIMLEPVMEYFYKQGRRVILNTLPNYFNIFQNHPYKLEHVAFLKENWSTYETINFDMSYEIKPKQLALKSYFETAGITDYVLRNPRLNHAHPPHLRIFKDQYIILHIDESNMSHRNVHGVDWKEVVEWIEMYTKYKVFQIGNGVSQSAAIKLNCSTETIMAFIIAGAAYFIGVDSGPAAVASACGVHSMIFFGSVKPEYRYTDMSNISTMQLMCPASKDGCYHETITTVGQSCEVDAVRPPCITWDTEFVKLSVEAMLNKLSHGI